jgi:hypothetical protein
VGVDRPRVRARHADRQVRAAGRGGGPEAERAVDVAPRARLATRGHDLLERVERPGVDVARLGADDRGPAAGGQRRGERVSAHPPLAVDVDPHGRVAPEAEQPQRVEHGRVRLGARDHAHRRRADQPARLDVPAGAREDGIARRRQRGGVRHLRARDEPDGGAGRQPEQLFRPAGDGLLGRRRRRRHHVQTGVLVPRRRQPVRADGRRQRAAGDEAEVARAGARDEPRLGRGRQRLDDRGGVLARVGQRPAQRVRLAGRADRPLAERREPVAGQRGRASQGVLAHRRTP